MFRGFSRKISSQDCNILMRILQLSVNYCIILMRILHFHSSFWSGRFFCQNMHILIRILQYLSENCNILMRILQSRLLNWSFRGLFEVSWPVKYGYSHENIAILEWELQYSHGNIAICTASFGLWRLVGALLEPLWGYVAPVCSFLLQCLHIWINVANSWWHWNALPVPLPRQVSGESLKHNE